MKTEIALVACGVVAVVVLALTLAQAVLPVCGLRFGTFGTLQFCPAPASGGPSPALAQEAERRAVLKDRVRRLERRLAALGACPPPAPEPAPPAPEPAPPEPEPAPPEPEPAPPEPESEGLDPERWRERDTALLEGCWSLSSDYRLRNVTTGAITQVDSWEMCFDTEGQGEQRFQLSDGDMCQAAVTAEFREDGRLRINDNDDIQCTRSSIYRRVTDCTLQPNGEAACISRQPELSSASNVRISRRTAP